MCRNAEQHQRRVNEINALRNAHDGELPAYSMLGMYAIMYITADSGVLCAACANGGNGSEASTDIDAPSDWRLEGFQTVEGETEEVRCDHCNTIISFAEAETEVHESHDRVTPYRCDSNCAACAEIIDSENS